MQQTDKPLDVWLVADVDYDHHEIVAAFYSEEEAEAYIKATNRKRWFGRHRETEQVTVRATAVEQRAVERVAERESRNAVRKTRRQWAKEHSDATD